MTPQPSRSDEEVALLASAIEQARADEKRPPKFSPVELPAWAQWLDVTVDEAGHPARHRVARGGRGGAKSWTFGRKLLMRGAERVERILCTREFQRSIRDSVKRLLDDEIERLGLGHFYQSTDKEIRGINGTLFVFAGLHRNEQGIKSLEGITVAWVEEAQAVSQSSINALIPTIRVEGSEIWWSYNPRLPTDPVDKMFYGAGGPPPGTILIPVNFEDNPWFPQTLRSEAEYDQRRDPDKYAHIWRGAYLQNSEAKVFRNWRIAPFETPAEAVLRHGADWGFAADPTVLIQAFIGRWAGEPGASDAIADWEGRCLFITAEAYSIGCPIDEIPALFGGNDTGQPEPRWLNPRGFPGVEGAKRWKIVADSARPELIAYLKSRGFNIDPAIKGKDSVEEGIEFLRSYDIVVHPNCSHVADELTHYSWLQDKLTGEILPQLADKDNHTIDALRYAMEAVRRAGGGRMDFASAGQRATLSAGRGAQSPDREKVRALSQPTRSAPSGGGAGWGSAPGIRGGL